MALPVADRVVALLEWGDVAEADSAIAEAEAADPGGWQPALWRGTRALMEGRFQACEQLAVTSLERGKSAGDGRPRLLSTLLLVALRREQERLAEAEVVLRAVLESSPSAPSGAHAMLALLMGDMGRDGQARQELARLLPADDGLVTGRLASLCLLAELAARLEAHDAVTTLQPRLRAHARDFAVEEGGCAFYGSASLALGRLALAAGRWDEAESSLSAAVVAHTQVGAPVLLAHSQRELAGLLRARGEAGDWERAVQLLSDATLIYRQLGVDRLASHTQEVLARAEDGLGVSHLPPGGDALFRRQGEGWLVGTEDEAVCIRDARGLQDIARLIATPRASIHVADLLTGMTDGAAMNVARQARLPAWALKEPVVDEQTRAEYEARLVELAADLVEAERAGNAVRAALAKAERDLLNGALADAGQGDPLDRARRAVGARIRISLDHIERAQPRLGHHLRRSIRTGTFCSYVPAQPVRWRL